VDAIKAKKKADSKVDKRYASRVVVPSVVRMRTPHGRCAHHGHFLHANFALVKLVKSITPVNLVTSITSAMTTSL